LTPVLAAGAALGVLWLALPIGLAETGNEPSTADCITLADAPSDNLQTLERCHQIVPNDVELAADLAALYEKGRPADAIALYQQILERDPWYADVRLRLARLLRDHGDPAAAQAQIDAALAVQPNRRALTDFHTGATR
jgi:tetratricopeptide (TPR) repeat protein